MNSSLLNVINHATSPKVLAVAKFLLDNHTRRVRVTFRKKDGTLRSMDFVPDGEYNSTFGIKSTNFGRKIVASKCVMDMITIQEILGDGHVQPRTVNLRTVESYGLV